MSKENNMEEINIYDLAELFKTFGDITRIRILSILYTKELSVNEISESIGLSQSAISHQLKNLKTSRLVKSRREGQQIYYSLDDDHVYKIIEQGIKHTKEKR